MLDRSVFFAAIRAAPFRGSLTPEQVAGAERILDAFDQHGSGDRRRLAYILATCLHETGGRMQPVREGFAPTDADAVARLDRAWARGQLKSVGAPYWREGWFGRGDVQLTHRTNYETMGRMLGLDLVGDPGLALDPAVSARIMIAGMERGAFTGAKLSDFIAGSRCDFVGARAVVNGTDRAAKIAGDAALFDAALVRAGATAPLRPAPAAAATARPVSPALLHATNGEPWYQSRVTWGAILSGLTPLLALAGWRLTPEGQDEIATALVALAPLVGAALTLYGRWRARAPIGAGPAGVPAGER